MTGEDICSAMEVRLYNLAGVRQNVQFPEAHSFKVMHKVADDGTCSFTLPLAAAAVKANPDVLETGIVRVAMVLGAGEAPTEIGGWELVPNDATLWAEEELVGQELRVTPRSLRYLLSYAPVQDELLTPFTDATAGTSRVFGWMSPASSYWYVSSDWVTPISLGLLNPKSWPAANRVLKITGTSTTPAINEVHLFRSTFTLTSDSTVKIWWVGDDIATLYVNSRAYGITPPGGKTRVTPIDLPAGTHTIAFEVKNTKPAQLKVAAVVATIDSNGNPATVLRYTDTTHWKVHKVVSGAYPGWTAAAIFLKLLAEAQTLGVEGASSLTPDFTATHDSAGVAWPHIEPTQVFTVGQTLDEVAKILEELAFDLHIKPDGTVQAFVSQGSDVHTNVVLEPGVNLLRLDQTGIPVAGTIAIVHTQAGWTQVTDAATSTYGDRYLPITSGNSGNLAQGQRLGVAALQSAAHPRYQYTAKIKAVPGAVPFRDFDEGSLITSLVRGGTNATVRVLSLSAETPEQTTGPVMFSLELEAV